MKRVSILRHAKASRDDPGLDDFDRPLTDRGRDDAALMAAFMEDRGIAPDFVLCSPALRTRQTLDAVKDRLAPGAQTHFDERLYLAQLTTLLASINAAPDECGHLLLIGHNPGLHALALELTDPSRADSPGLALLAEKFPTSGLAQFVFEAARWADTGAARGALIFFETPKTVREAGGG